MSRTIIIAALTISIILSIVISPDVSLQASLQGLSIWWNIVFPGMLPFLILIEMITAFGLAHGMNTFMVSFTTKFLKLPKVAGLPLIYGLLCGFPAATETIVKLYQNKLLNRKEALALMNYCHLPNPIMMLVIVGVGFFQSAFAGWLIALAVWVSSFLLMIISQLSFQRRDLLLNHDFDTPSKKTKKHFSQEMELGRSEDGRTFGRVLGDSVSVSVQKLFVIGGFIMFTSVIAKLFEPVFVSIVSKISNDSFTFIPYAILEMHIGTNAIFQWSTHSEQMLLSCALAAAALAFSGLSGIMQHGYHLADTTLSIRPFLIYRGLHAVAAFICTYLLWLPLNKIYFFIFQEKALPVLQYQQQLDARYTMEMTSTNMPHIWIESLLVVCSLLCCFIIIHFLTWTRSKRYR